MRRSRTRSRLTTTALVLCAAMTCGCAYLRVPRIDPTGQRLFAEPPIAGTPQYTEEPGGQLPGDDVAAILSPHEVVAPVGSEVVLLAGVRGPDGYLRTNRRLEWSLSPGGVGYFVSVGRNGLVDVLLGDFNRPRKIDNTFAIGSTSRRYLRLTRGTPTTSDDVCVLRGQGWITVSSPIEGTSRINVCAPGVYSWYDRKDGATIRWVDAQWSFPPLAINPSGTTHVLTTTVIRQSVQSACVGWKVRYEIVDGPPAGFSPDGAQSVEVETDAAGQASAEIFQKEPKPGTNTIAVRVIRPASLGDSPGEQLVVATGTTTKTWTSPDLAIRKIGPATAGLGATLSYRIEVSNPGDLPAEDVIVTDELSEALTLVDSDPPAEVSGQKLRWTIGPLGARESRTIGLNCRVTRQGSVTNCADVTASGGLKASDCVATTVVAPTIDVKITGPTQATVGSEVTFRILVTNRSQVTAKGLLIKDRFGDGLEHAVAPSPIERELGDLGPGESRTIDVTFRVTKAGQLSNTAEVTGADGTKTSAQATLTAVGAAGTEAGPTAPEPLPSGQAAVTIEKSLIDENGLLLDTGGQRPSFAVEAVARFAIDVTNAGTQTLTNLKIVDQYDPSLVPVKATDTYRFENNDLVWTIDRLPTGKTERLVVHCRCRTAVTGATNRAVVASQEGAQAEHEVRLDIRAAAGGLTITAADLRDPVAAGKGLTYEIRVSNEGQMPARDLAVVATVPVGMVPDRIGTSGPGKPIIEKQTVRFQPVAEIAPGKTLVYYVRVGTRLPGKLIFRAELSSPDLPQPLTAEQTTEVFQ